MIVVRSARQTDASKIATVHVETWKEAYVGLLDSGFLDSMTPSRMTRHWRRALSDNRKNLDDAVFVAATNSDVVGFVTVSACRDVFAPWEAEITMLYVLEAYRGAGIGRALMKAAADHALARGMFTGGLWVLRDNLNARGFYEAMGGDRCGRKMDTVGGRTVPLVGYSWSEVAELAERTIPQPFRISRH